MTLVYLIFLLLAAYCSFKYDALEENDQHKSHRFWMLCGLLICISGFSYGLGGDKFVYMDNFERLSPDLSFYESIYFGVLIQGNMPLWTILNLLVKQTFDSFYVIQFIQSTIVNLGFCYIIRRYTHRWFMFLLVYFLSEVFFQFNMEVMREGIAIALSMFAAESYMDGKKGRFFALIATAMLFHISATIMLAFPFIRLRITKWTLPAAFAIAGITWVASDFILTHIAVLALGGIGMLIQKVLFYAVQASNIFGFLRSAITYIIFPFIIMYFGLLWEDNEEMRQRKEKLISFHIFLSILGCAFAGLSRFRNYMEIYYLVMLADFCYMLFRTKRYFIIRSCTLAGTIFLIALKYFLYYPLNKAYFYQLFVPYTCILDEDRHVYFREDIHKEAVTVIASDDNVRDIK